MTNQTEALSSGNYSRLIVSFYLGRIASRYIFFFYLPVFILVLLTWIPVRISNVTGRGGHIFSNRMRFLAIILLTFFLLSTGHWFYQPASNRLTIADYYFLFSLLIIVLAFVDAARRYCNHLRSASTTLPSYNQVLCDSKTTKENVDVVEVMAVPSKCPLFATRFWDSYFVLPVATFIVYGFYYAKIVFFMV